MNIERREQFIGENELGSTNGKILTWWSTYNFFYEIDAYDLKYGDTKTAVDLVEADCYYKELKQQHISKVHITAMD